VLSPIRAAERSTLMGVPCPLNRERLVRIGRRVLIFVLVAPFVVWIGLSIGLKFTLAEDAPFSQLVGMVGAGLFGGIVCSVTGCEADLPEGMEIATFTSDLVEDTTVALDTDERGRVYVVETARQRAGGEDNRSHPYWLMDDLASRTIEDRAAYYEKALSEGRFEEPDHFTRFVDRVVRIEDTDGDGVADERIILAEWNEMVSGLISGVEAREGEVFVTSVPSLYRLRDTTGDDIPDAIDEIHRGFGVKTSLGGHDLHGLVWGPDGKLYFSMGDRGYHVELDDGQILEPALGPGRGAVFRMNRDGSGLEVFATGVRNPQELAFDDHGNLFTGDNNGDGGDQARLVYVVEGGETGWAMPYQSLAGDYVRGPWMAERLWELQHPTQPAWILPPVAYIGNGPSGFAHYPGLGLPDRYADHFFLCDYGYTNGRSGVWSFAVEPKGATFEMTDKHQFAWGMLATDVDFGWDGRIRATIFDQMSTSQNIVTISDPESLTDPRVEALEDHVAGKMSDKATSTLVELLGFADQRLRIRAQDELVARSAMTELLSVAREAGAERLPRLHALWGLGQMGIEGLRALSPESLAWASSEDDEFRAQLMKVVGTARAGWLRGDLESALTDAAPRVRFFAAQSLGALGDAASVAPLFELIRRNADEDVYLRHAAVYALSRLEGKGAMDAIWARADDPDRSVRLAVLLVLRRAMDARVETFLSDADSQIVVEAARAIYDGPIDSGMATLAGLANTLEPATAEDLQSGQALHRRVIGANVRLRSASGATALARYVVDESQLESLRAMALEALGTYTKPPLRDLTMGFYRPLADASPDLLADVFQAHGRALVDSSLGSRALEIASEIDEMPLSDEELVEISIDAEAASSTRISALRALAMRPNSARLAPVAQAALQAGEGDVRSAGRELLLAIDRRAGIDALAKAASDAATLQERQHAYQRLGDLDASEARATLHAAVDAWAAGELETAVALEVLEAASRQSDVDLAKRAQTILAAAADRPVESRRWALEGGDAKAGERVFQTYGDCQRCHGDGGGHDAGVGPTLAGVSRRGAEYVLESILEPQAQIAEGFATIVVTKTDGSVAAGLRLSDDENGLRLLQGAEQILVARSEISDVSEPTTGMPPIGLGLEPRSLRDVVAYVMSVSEDDS
jgi:quinoprotein glucose dehydrogenase